MLAASCDEKIFVAFYVFRMKRFCECVHRKLAVNVTVRVRNEMRLYVAKYFGGKF